MGITGTKKPSISILKKSILKNHINIIDLVIISQFENSRSEIRRLIKGSGVRINNQIINDEKLIISEKLFEDNTIKLSLGKKRHIKVEIN